MIGAIRTASSRAAASVQSNPRKSLTQRSLDSEWKGHRVGPKDCSLKPFLFVPQKSAMGEFRLSKGAGLLLG
jgi:hypothetical protein